jgi:hypothetical protein
LLFLPPESSFGPRRRHSGAIEIKGGPGLIVPLDPSAVLITANEPIGLSDFDHLTLHADLMIHAKSQKTNRRFEVSPPSHPPGDDDQPRRLCLLGAGNAFSMDESGTERYQTTFSGGSAILSVVPNSSPLPNEQAVLELWALPLNSARVPIVPPAPNALVAVSATGDATFGPMASNWAFRWATPPSCSFGFVTWWVSAPRANGRPFVAPGHVGSL